MDFHLTSMAGHAGEIRDGGSVWSFLLIALTWELVLCVLERKEKENRKSQIQNKPLGKKEASEIS